MKRKSGIDDLVAPPVRGLHPYVPGKPISVQRPGNGALGSVSGIVHHPIDHRLRDGGALGPTHGGAFLR